jgi:hypothetical protein
MKYLADFGSTVLFFVIFCIAIALLSHRVGQLDMLQYTLESCRKHGQVFFEGAAMKCSVISNASRPVQV